MTEPGQTDNFSVSDHINTIIEHCGEGLIDYCLYDTGEVIPEFIKKYNLDGAELVEQDCSKVKDKKIKFIKENMSIIKDDFVRHNSMIIADTLIKIICDDLKFKDRQNDPEYMMMNSKLKADKEIIKENKRKSKNKKSGDEKKYKSKFANKYKTRMDSIKYADERAEKRKKHHKENELNTKKDQETIQNMKEKQKQILQAYKQLKNSNKKDE